MPSTPRGTSTPAASGRTWWWTPQGDPDSRRTPGSGRACGWGRPDSLGALDSARLAADPGAGLVIERILALLYDLAAAINRAALPGRQPGTPADSFGAAERAGMIDAELADALAPADGPHHVLVQLCLDTEPEKVPAIVAAARSGYREYVRQVTDWITTGPGKN
ncbi:hypothetical protein [Streptomyces sp. NPDC001100]